MYIYRTISYCNIIIIIIIFDKELNARGACLYLNSKKSNGNKRKNLLGKNERIGLQKSDGNKGIGLMMPITITSEINPILHCNIALSSKYTM